MSWRETARPIIANVLEEHSGDEKELRRKLRDAYPFGKRQYHPYKIWLDEIRRQRGFKGRAEMRLKERLGQMRIEE